MAKRETMGVRANKRLGRSMILGMGKMIPRPMGPSLRSGLVGMLLIAAIISQGLMESARRDELAQHLPLLQVHRSLYAEEMAWIGSLSGPALRLDYRDGDPPLRAPAGQEPDANPPLKWGCQAVKDIKRLGEAAPIFRADDGQNTWDGNGEAKGIDAALPAALCANLEAGAHCQQHFKVEEAALDWAKNPESQALTLS